ncbi:MAG: HIT family protein [Flavobacteriales bacterium]|nr:HIT family protein [Flavobacteriales bacterium]MCB9165909.1 HIT family protein [Flavobacteriales bacterium]
MASIFTRIVDGEIPAYKVAEDERFLAFLDIHPLREGHTLVVPKAEVDYLFDLDDGILSSILPFARDVARKIARVVPCARVGISVIGLEVPHAHVHLIPIDGVDDMDFGRPKLELAQERFQELAERIRNA